MISIQTISEIKRLRYLGNSIVTISKLTGIHRNSIRKYIKNITPSPVTIQDESEFDKLYDIYISYVTNELNSNQLSKKYNYYQRNILDILKYFNKDYKKELELYILKHGKVCYKCKKRKHLSEFHKNITSSFGVSAECKECVKLLNPHRKRYLEEKKLDKAYKKKYNERIFKCMKNRLKKDPGFRLETRLRKRINVALKNNTKSGHFIDLLGCSVDQLKDHLQNTAIENGYKNFDINNYSGREYHIDHIVPCSLFNLECSYHQKLCFHYTNLQILTAQENLIKSNDSNII
jgi:hypothetical protein